MGPSPEEEVFESFVASVAELQKIKARLPFGGSVKDGSGRG